MPVLPIIGTSVNDMLIVSDQSFREDPAQLRLEAIRESLLPTEMVDLCSPGFCQNLITPGRQVKPWLFRKQEHQVRDAVIGENACIKDHPKIRSYDLRLRSVRKILACCDDLIGQPVQGIPAYLITCLLIGQQVLECHTAMGSHPMMGDFALFQ